MDNGAYEYKITRGSWNKVECRKDGSSIENRSFKLQHDTTIEIIVEEWSDKFPSPSRQSTASSHVKIIDTAFAMPQLGRTRKVWIYLPEGYEGSSQKYPVLYMHDGQNVFDNATSFAGEWGVDEYMDSTKANKSIVVAIDHGGPRRINEYCPYDMDKYGKGEGVSYVDFLVNNLKPFIDSHYRTLADKKNTFIAGSSMGGLISMYAILKYPDTFGGAGVFSPAFWVGSPGIFNDIKEKGKKVKARIYFYCGKLEGETMVPDMQKAYDEMKRISKSKMELVVREDGKHNEARWRVEFPMFYRWLISQSR
jgi:alpha-glucosidase